MCPICNCNFRFFSLHPQKRTGKESEEEEGGKEGGHGWEREGMMPFYHTTISLHFEYQNWPKTNKQTKPIVEIYTRILENNQGFSFENTLPQIYPNVCNIVVPV